MAFLIWDNQFSLNVKKIDEQHKHLFDLLNKLHDVVVEGAEQSLLAHILDELIEYTVYHFGTEEKLFAEHQYPEYTMHKREHDDLTRQVVKFQRTFREGSATISFELLDFLRRWLTKHTLGTDRKYAAFMNAREVF